MFQNAITSTGAGGMLATTLVNGVDAFSLFLTATLCFAGPWVVNAVGFRWAMVIAPYVSLFASFTSLFRRYLLRFQTA